MSKLLCALFAVAAVFAKEAKIDLISNNPVDVAVYQEALKKHQVEVRVSNCELLGKAFQKKHDLVHKWMRKLSLDYPRTIEVDADKIVWMNIPNHFYRDHAVAKLPKEKMVLFMWEPYIRLRKMYNKNLHRCFSRIYTWDDDLVDNKRFFKFHYPVLQQRMANLPLFEEKKFCTMIAGRLCSKGSSGNNF